MSSPVTVMPPGPGLASSSPSGPAAGAAARGVGTDQPLLPPHHPSNGSNSSSSSSLCSGTEFMELFVCKNNGGVSEGGREGGRERGEGGGM